MKSHQRQEEVILQAKFLLRQYGVLLHRLEISVPNGPAFHVNHQEEGGILICSRRDVVLSWCHSIGCHRFSDLGALTGQSDIHLLEVQSPAQELSGGRQLHCTANLEVWNLRFAQRREGNEILLVHFCENGRRKKDCLLVKHALPQRGHITSMYSQVHVPLLFEQKKFSEQQLSDSNSYHNTWCRLVCLYPFF